MKSIWGDCEKHQIPLEVRHCENGKSYNYCPQCEKEQADRLKEMFNKEN